MIEIFLLSLIQGITEFIPVSSSSHLILFSNYTNFEEQSLLIDVSLHIGSFLAVLCYFYKDILNFINNQKLHNKYAYKAHKSLKKFEFEKIETKFERLLINL